MPAKRVNPAKAVKPAGRSPKKVAASKPDKPKKIRKGSPDHWNLRLYVAGQTPKSIAAIANLRRFCEEHLPGRYAIEVVDLLENPGLARKHDIIAIPTLVRDLPAPMRKIIGDLSNREKVLVGFDIRSDS